MKHLVALLLLYPTLAASQGWEWQNPYPTAHSFDEVQVFDEDNAIAVAGPVFSTTDGGNSWIMNPGTVAENLLSLHFLNEDLGWAVGYSGSIRHTTDGGQTWTVQPSPTTGALTSVYFVDPNNGWAVGDLTSSVIIHTTDGGSSWSEQVGGTSGRLTSVYFVNPNVGWIVGEFGTIIKTTDGGLRWRPQNSNTMNLLTSISFVTEDLGWAVGYQGTVLRTTNGGTTWSKLTSLHTDNWLYDVDFINENTGWAVGNVTEVGNAGTIYWTATGGDIWVVRSPGVSYRVNSVDFVDSQTGWAVGSGGSIMHSMDGGDTWDVESSNLIPVSLNGSSFINADTGWAVGRDLGDFDGHILQTTDGGITWNDQSVEQVLNSVQFVNSISGWAVGYNGTILHTSNGGNSWAPQSSRTRSELEAVRFVDLSNGWVAGRDGTLLHTTNGGASWEPQTIGTTNWFTSLAFTDSKNGWVVSQSDGGIYTGEIYHTTDGGNSWTLQYTTTTHHLVSVFFADQNSGWVSGSGISGSGGIILHTTDSGQSWNAQLSGTDDNLVSVCFSDANTGWTVGGGTILHTTDGGAAWVSQPRAGGGGGSSGVVIFVDGSQGWILGSGGTILHTATGGTGIEPPPPPTLSSPPNGSTASTNPLLIWNPAPDALWYTLQVSTSPYFITYVLNQTNLTEPSYSLSGLEGGTTYYWRVSLRDETGTSRYSSVWSFTAETSPSDPLAQYGVCYGSTGDAEPSNPGALITIDPLTGAGTLVGPTGIVGDNGPSVRALAIKSTGEMYAMSHTASSDLYSVNASTGAGTFVANTGLLHPGDICFDAEDVLYAVDETNVLYTIDETTGVRTVVGSTGVALAGLAYDPTDGTMFGSGSADDIYTIDLETGDVTLVGTTGLGGNTPDIHFDQAGNLFGVKRGASGVYDYISIDKTTGAGSLIGSTGFVAVVGLATRLEPPVGIPCDEITNFQARCRTGGTIQARLTLANTNYTGELVEFSIDGTPYQVTVGPNGRASLSIGVSDVGLHTVELTEPAGCVDPLTVPCQSGVALEGDDFWNDELSWEIPAATTLVGNYPNPFNPSTTFRYALAEPGLVNLKVYDMLGRLVRTIVDEHQLEGYHEAVWDGRNEVGATVSSGIYIYRLTAGGSVETKRMILMK